METGKVDTRSVAEIAASHVCTEACDPEKAFKAAAHRHIEDIRAKRAIEHARLKDAVIASVKTWRREFGGNIHLEALASTALAQDADALIAFEAENKIGE